MKRSSIAVGTFLVSGPLLLTGASQVRQDAGGPPPTPIAPAAAEFGGLAWADVDLDGLDDVLVRQQGGAVVLLRNLGDGGFADVTAPYGLSDLAAVRRAWWTDYDGDKLPDLFVLTTSGEGRLLHHGGASFVDVSAAAGLDAGFATSDALWTDYDRDARPDLLLTGAREHRLYHNLGAGVFETVDLPGAPALELAVVVPSAPNGAAGGASSTVPSPTAVGTRRLVGGGPVVGMTLQDWQQGEGRILVLVSPVAESRARGREIAELRAEFEHLRDALGIGVR